jgi:quinol monooxygenase YgiN
MPVYMTAQFTVRPESVEKCQAAIAEFVDYVTRNEPSTRIYISLEEVDNEASFLNFFIFEDEAAEEHHANSEAAKHFTDILYPECIEPVRFTSYRLVASTEE